MKSRISSSVSARHLRAARLIALAALFGMEVQATARADTYTWTGGSGATSNNYNWSNAGNWQGNVAPPVNGLGSIDVNFGGAASTLSYVDNTYSIRSLSFVANAGAFVFEAGSLTLGGGGLNQNAGNAQVFDTTQVILGANQTWTLASGSGALVFSSGVATGGYALTISAGTTTGSGNMLNGPITGGGNLTKTGAGTLTLTGASTYTGNTRVSAGTLAITGSATGGGTLTVDGTSAAPATLTLGSTGSLSTSDVYVGVDGVGTITQSGGSLFLGTHVLILGANFFSSGTYNLNGGTLTTRLVIDNIGTGAFHFNGGTLQAGASDTPGASTNPSTFFTGLTTADVQAGGAFIDTQTYNVTVAQGLTSGVTSGTDGGLTKLGAGTLTLTGTNTYTGTTTISAGKLQVGSGSTTGSPGTGAITDNAALAFNRSNNLTLANVISGTGSLTQLGTGTLTLTGTSSYKGATTVGAGTLAFTGNVQIGGRTSALTVDGATVSTSNPGGVTLNVPTLAFSAGTLDANVIYVGKNDTGNVTQSGGTITSATGGNPKNVPAPLYLGYNTNSTGTYNLSGGTLNTGAAYLGYYSRGTEGDFMQTGGIFDTNGNTLSVGGAGYGSYTMVVGTLYAGEIDVYNGDISQKGGIAQTNQNSLIVGIQGSTASYTLSGGTLDTTLNRSGTVSATAGVTQLGSANDGGGSGGTASFEQTGGTHTTGTLSFQSNNANSRGTYTLTGGTLETNAITADDHGAGGTSTFNFNGGTLQIFADNPTLTQGLTTVNVQAGGATIDTRNHSVTVGRNLLHDTTAGAPATDSGLTKLGSGTLTLGGVNTYTGATTVSDGTLNLANALALQNSTLYMPSDNGTVTFDSSVSGNAFALGGLRGYGGLALVNNAATPAAVALTVGGNNQSTTFAAELSGAGSLTKTGSGTLTLSHENTYTGATTISAGTLLFTSAGALYDGVIPTADKLRVASGATAAFTVGSAYAFTSDQIGALAALGTASGGFQNGAVLDLRTDVGGSTVTISANLSNPNGGANALSLAIDGGFGISLTGNNTYTGGTLLTGGVLNVGSPGALGTTGTLSFNGGTLRYSAANRTDYSGRFNQTGSQAYSIDTNGQSVTFGTALNAAGGSLTKLGAGTLKLAGASQYGGGTTVSAGTLLVINPSGSGTGTGTVTVSNAGSVLGGTGAVAGAVTVNSGAAVLGGDGSTTAGALTLQGGADPQHRRAH